MGGERRGTKRNAEVACCVESILRTKLCGHRRDVVHADVGDGALDRGHDEGMDRRKIVRAYHLPPVLRPRR